MADLLMNKYIVIDKENDGDTEVSARIRYIGIKPNIWCTTWKKKKIGYVLGISYVNIAR